uniref:Uncharacterized protein LOC113790660 n=1 Tax=Dermatophagoides pteronyssinus TaxID=6956 RepID=A0A6P6XTI2_DERPT
MEFLETLGYIMIVIVLFKLFGFTINLLLSQYGRTIGLGVKYISSNGEFAVISGATGILGREFAQEFASMGYNLVLIAKNGQKLDNLEQRIRRKYNTMKHIIKIPVDLTIPESYATLRQQLADVNQIVVLVNCISCCPEPAKFWKSSESKFNLLMINVMAPLILMEELMPRFIQQNRGIIINVGAQAGDFRFPKYSTYAACKSFIHTMSEIMAAECTHTNIYVQTIKPCSIAHKSKATEESFFCIPSRLIAYSALLSAGFETSHYGHWKHRLSGLLLNIMVFLFGHRWTTFIIGLFIPTVKKGKDDFDQKNLTRSSSSSASMKKLPKYPTPSPLTPSPSSTSPLTSLDNKIDHGGGGGGVGGVGSSLNSSEESTDIMIDFNQGKKTDKRYAPTPSPLVNVSDMNETEVVFKLTPPSQILKNKNEKNDKKSIPPQAKISLKKSEIIVIDKPATVINDNQINNQNNQLKIANLSTRSCKTPDFIDYNDNLNMTKKETTITTTTTTTNIQDPIIKQVRLDDDSKKQNKNDNNKINVVKKMIDENPPPPPVIKPKIVSLVSKSTGLESKSSLVDNNNNDKNPPPPPPPPPVIKPKIISLVSKSTGLESKSSLADNNDLNIPTIKPKQMLISKTNNNNISKSKTTNISKSKTNNISKSKKEKSKTTNISKSKT